jgi:peptidoglycan hydrolase-like protein with peptidoglycan-binding domain
MKKKTTIFLAATLLTLTPVTVLAATSGGNDPLLHFGSLGSSVSELQRDLNAAGYSVGTADGIFGLNTLREVRAFQAGENLTADGMVGPLTWNALLHGNTSNGDIKSIYQSAIRGQLPGLPFVVGQSNIDQVQNAWGQPNSENFAGAGTYETFSAHHAAFGMNKGAQLFDLRSYAPTLRPITENAVEQVLGRPGAVHYYGGETILLYPAGPNNQLQWIFSTPTRDSTTPHLDHISVFNPQATVDLMAQENPAPSVTVDNAPGTVGHLFTFSISKPPTGYAVTEFEWLGSNGETVINTYDQAVRNGQTGGTPGFEISGDGQTISFVYNASMIHQMGKVRLIYQMTSGSAIIGDSQNITLK